MIIYKWMIQYKCPPPHFLPIGIDLIHPVLFPLGLWPPAAPPPPPLGLNDFFPVVLDVDVDVDVLYETDVDALAVYSYCSRRTLGSIVDRGLEDDAGAFRGGEDCLIRSDGLEKASQGGLEGRTLGCLKSVPLIS